MPKTEWNIYDLDTETRDKLKALSKESGLEIGHIVNECVRLSLNERTNEKKLRRRLQEVARSLKETAQHNKQEIENLLNTLMSDGM